LLERIHPNSKAGYDEFALFEMGKAHITTLCDADGLPLESEQLGLVYTAKAGAGHGTAFYEARMYVEYLAAACGVQLDYLPLSGHETAMDGPLDPSRSAVIKVRGVDVKLGVIGELRATTLTKLKLSPSTAVFEIDVATLSQLPPTRAVYLPLPKFPKVSQDICLKVTVDTPYREVTALVEQTLTEIAPEQTLTDVSPIDIYRRAEDAAHKQVTLRISIVSYERTLTDAEVAHLLDTIAARAKEKMQAERI
jgi:phenylalanyl-tRNA synthetase beta subunit